MAYRRLELENGQHTYAWTWELAAQPVHATEDALADA